MPAKVELLSSEGMRTQDDYCLDLISRSQTDVWDPAHGKLHLTNVALLTDAWGIQYRLEDRRRRVIRVSGFLHDIVRSPSEGAESASLDERSSADIVFFHLEKLNQIGVLSTTDTERRAGKYAVETHGRSPWMEDPSKVNRRPRVLSERFRETLTLADRMEQIDIISAALRRAMFVSGRRLQSTEGDLQKMGFDPNSESDRLKAFLQESVIRVTFINPESHFPKRVQHIMNPLFVAQRDFIQALSKAVGINSTEDMARLLLETQDNQGNNLLDLRGLKYRRNISTLRKKIEEQGRFSSEVIQGSSVDLAASASETVLYLSSSWQQRDLEQVVDAWHPRNQAAGMLKNKFREYVSGEWAVNKQHEILNAA